MKNHKDELAIITAIAANFLTLITLIYTIYNSNSQLNLTRRLAQNNAIYEMQKDQRLATKEYREGKEDTLQIFLIMNEIYVQYVLNNIPAEIWPIFQADFCQTLTNTRFRNDWQLNMPDKVAFLQAFVQYVNKILALPQGSASACLEIKS